jgi:hypothetical protein
MTEPHPRVSGSLLGILGPAVVISRVWPFAHTAHRDPTSGVGTTDAGAARGR